MPPFNCFYVLSSDLLSDYNSDDHACCDDTAYHQCSDHYLFLLSIYFLQHSFFGSECSHFCLLYCFVDNKAPHCYNEQSARCCCYHMIFSFRFDFSLSVFVFLSSVPILASVSLQLLYSLFSDAFFLCLFCFPFSVIIIPPPPLQLLYIKNRPPFLTVCCACYPVIFLSFLLLRQRQ